MYINLLCTYNYSLQFTRLINVGFFHSAVLQPDVNIAINQNPPLYTGSILTLTCTVTLGPYVDKSGNITVAIEWSGQRNISSNRYSIITPAVNSSSIYTSNLTISHIETQDSGIYTCTARVTGSDYVQQASASDIVSITVDEKKIKGMCTHLTHIY